MSLEKKENQVVFSQAALLTKMDRRHKIELMLNLLNNTNTYGNNALANQNTAH